MRWWASVMLLVVGCGPYTEAQMRLVEEARRGVRLCAQAQGEHRQVSDELATLRRQRLDEAFDADVRQQVTLSPAWVIEHRRAYAVGLEALNQEHLAALRAQQVTGENLQAIDAALERLYWLQTVQVRWWAGSEK